MTILCAVCGKPFTLRSNKRKHCSRDCRINKPIDRFWSKVDKTGDCWIWTGTQSGRGYGVITINKVHHRTHRYAWELENGPMPAHLDACHTCDNPACVRPSHIFPGTHAENMRDSSRKGRNGMQRYPERSSLRSDHARLQVRGERQGSAKLTADKVRAIRQMSAEGMTSTVIAPLMGVTPGVIRGIVRRDSWKHVL